jgi:guanylate kinase
MIFVSPPSTEVLSQRLRSRGDTASDDIATRLKIAEIQLEEAPSLFDHIVVNDLLDRAAQKVANLIIGSR